jgi:hypothetical protein
MKSSIAAVVLLLTSTWAFRADAQGTPSFPIVFNKAGDLNKLGIVILHYTNDDVAEFPNSCYYYGDGGYTLSFSAEFLARLKQRGFSRRSVCMGIVSQVTYDPQSGRHLPTFILSRRKSGKIQDAGDVSDELPLDLPNCFSGGRPLSDCTWNYDMLTGKALSKEDAGAIAKVGSKIDSLFAAGKFKGCAGPGKYDPCRLSWDEYHLKFPKNFTSSLSFLDVSTDFPKGYGYTLNAEGGAGPEPGAAAAEQAGDPKRRATEQTIQDLKRILSGQ